MVKFRVRQRQPRSARRKRPAGGKCQLRSKEVVESASETVAKATAQLSENVSDEMTREFVSQRRNAVKDAVYHQGLTGVIERGSKRDIHMRTQANVVAAIATLQLAREKTDITYSEFSNFFAGKPPCSRATFHRVRKKYTKEGNRRLSFSKVMTRLGRPNIFLPKVDDIFVAWLKDKETPVADKVMLRMINKYRELHASERGEVEAESLLKDSIRHRITSLLQKINYHMQTPRIVDSKRCVSFKTLQAWYSNPRLRKALSGDDLHPMLCFNADETSINRKGAASGKVASMTGIQPTVVTDDLATSHVSLFVTVSAAGAVAPCVVLHGSPDVYVKDPTQFPDLRFYKTSNGYMDKKTFKKVLEECFIPFVEEQRQKLELLESLGKSQRDDSKRGKQKQVGKKRKGKRRAVLIVDGHRSRYDYETFTLLRKANIDLVILPAHSSHLTQPLDRKLNAQIKVEFRRFYNEGLPECLMKCILHERKKKNVSRKAKRTKTMEDNTKPKEKTKTPAEDEEKVSKRKRRKYVKETEKTAEKTPAEDQEEECIYDVEESKDCEDVQYFFFKNEYTRMLIANSIRGALRVALNPSSILSAWECSKLYPFTGKPPYSQQAEDKLWREIEASATFVPPRNARRILITGLVNDDVMLKHLKDVVSSDIQLQRFTIQQNFVTSSSIEDTQYEAYDENADIGDTVFAIDGPNGVVYYGESDAAHFARIE